MKTAVEWLIEQIENNVHHTIRIPREFFDQAKEMEKEQQNNLPIHIHEGISNTHVYIEDGVVNVKPNETFKSE
jgi:hypothetical protein